MNECFELCSMPEAVRRMNVWGAARRPFVFVVNYARDAAFVELAEDVNPEVCRYDFRGVSNVAAGASCVRHRTSAGNLIRRVKPSMPRRLRSYTAI